MAAAHSTRAVSATQKHKYVCDLRMLSGLWAETKSHI